MITLPRIVLTAAVKDRGDDFRALSAQQQEILESCARGYSELAELPSFTANEIISVLLPYARKLEKKSFARMLETMIGEGSGKKDPKVPSLEGMPALMERHLMASLIDGWLYKLHDDGAHYPYLMEKVVYVPADKRHNTPAQVRVTLARIRGYEIDRTGLTFDYGDARGKTISEILARKELLRETPELKQEYTDRRDRYFTLLPNIGQQYECRERGMVVGQYGRTNFIDHGLEAGGARFVNDHRPQELRTSESKAEPSQVSGNCEWLEGERPDGALIPIHPVVLCFNLGTHNHEWVNSAYLEVHDYDCNKKDMLILPDDHHDLIDALLEQSASGGDVIEGKNAGTIVLCMGPAGVGKTLTAEAWSEAVGKPLYRVHAGQLGTSSDDIEKSLKEVTERARAWNAIALIDEADVFIKERGDDVNQTALVAAFLRTLEYYDGALFMTTNRTDIDDAIVSRCIAIVKYKMPDENARTRLWRLFAGLHKSDLSEEDISKLVEMFPAASGRDIKMLFSLSKRYCTRRQKPLTPDVFRYVGQFRGF